MKGKIRFKERGGERREEVEEKVRNGTKRGIRKDWKGSERRGEI